jgi:glycosyltransferase involved in cell wall biosynthesis
MIKSIEREKGNLTGVLNNKYIVCDPPKDALIFPIVNLNNPPCVSFCIPTLNNEETIEKCLKSIVAQDYANIEIIIIDGYSTDKTIQIVQKYTDKIFFDTKGYGSACQIGFEAASGQIIASMDSDIIIPHKDWLKNAIPFFNYSDRVCCVWPICMAPPNASPFTQLYQTYFHRLIIDNRIKTGKSYYGGGNSLFSKNAFERIGGINCSIHWGADFDWAKKFKMAGFQVIFSSDPLYHDTMRTIKQFVRKQFYGAKTFTNYGFQLMGLTLKDILYEHFILGMKGMICGIFRDKNYCWFYYPLLVSIRIFVFTLMKFFNSFSWLYPNNKNPKKSEAAELNG